MTATSSKQETGPAVRVERRERTLVMTLDRPAVRNAVNAQMSHELAATLDLLDGDPDLVVGVLTGAGGCFCSGMDLGAFARGESPVIPGRGFAGITRVAATKPLIAAVEGFAVGGGLEIALSCDLVVAATGARLGLPEVKRSLVAAAGGLVKLPRKIPQHVAMEMALTGEPLPAERLAELGLINRLSRPGETLDDALELAGMIAQNGPLAVIASKRIVNEQRGWADDELWDRQEVIARPVLSSRDAKEGATAFKEKRPPVWTGS